MNLVGSSVVSAITQTPASGPLLLVTTPPMSSLSAATVGGACDAPMAMPSARTIEPRATVSLMACSLLESRDCATNPDAEARGIDRLARRPTASTSPLFPPTLRRGGPRAPHATAKHLDR